MDIGQLIQDAEELKAMPDTPDMYWQTTNVNRKSNITIEVGFNVSQPITRYYKIYYTPEEAGVDFGETIEITCDLDECTLSDDVKRNIKSMYEEDTYVTRTYVRYGT